MTPRGAVLADSMALPPEPIERVLPLAKVVVVADVITVVDLDEWPAPGKGPPDSGHRNPAQQVTLRVARALLGTVDGDVVVTKPAGAYAVDVGTTGAFLLDADNVILGRYGPDTWSVDAVIAAIAASSGAP